MPPRAQAREYLQLFVVQPYLELHTAPGRGYPVTQVVVRGESVDVLMRRTDWFKVRTERGIEGWANERDLAQTTLADGSPFQINLGDRDGFTSHRWESGIFGGAYEGATLISAYQALSLTDHLKVELSASQFLGNLSNGWLVDLGLSHVFMPEWRISPFVTLGGGYERVEPKATLALPVSSSNQTAYVGVGVRYYLARRLFLRGELRAHEIFTNQNANEVKNEWKVGIAFFY
ncbi:MAG TPA: SH3 domain-containing protein [Steroidobacteraceae bacterium]